MLVEVLKEGIRTAAEVCQVHTEPAWSSRDLLGRSQHPRSQAPVHPREIVQVFIIQPQEIHGQGVNSQARQLPAQLQIEPFIIKIVGTTCNKPHRLIAWDSLENRLAAQQHPLPERVLLVPRQFQDLGQLPAAGTKLQGRLSLTSFRSD